jgi:hypothetical protein
MWVVNSGGGSVEQINTISKRLNHFDKVANPGKVSLIDLVVQGTVAWLIASPNSVVEFNISNGEVIRHFGP